MPLFNTITRILVIATVIIGIGVAAFFIFSFVTLKKRKSAVNKIKENEPIGKKRDTSEFIPVEYIRDGMIKVEKENRFIASVNCKGFDYYAVDKGERLMTQDGYLSFIRTIQNPVTLRIDSSAVDLSSTIVKHEARYEECMSQQCKMMESFSHYSKMLKTVIDPVRKKELAVLVSDLGRKIDCNEWRIKHLANLISYQKGMSGRSARPIQEERYVFDWTYNPGDFSQDLSDEEIYEKAREELDAQEHRFKNALSMAHVKCRRDGTGELFNLVYRHFNPWSSDTYKSYEGLNDEERIVSGKRSYEWAREEYRTMLKKKELERIINGGQGTDAMDTESHESEENTVQKPVRNTFTLNNSAEGGVSL